MYVRAIGGAETMTSNRRRHMGRVLCAARLRFGDYYCDDGTAWYIMV
jgi:hypothetical protein